jgi:phenylpropionate dioxygenase-like ring-hydroxylating dioxygenase large terminal subunit
VWLENCWQVIAFSGEVADNLLPRKIAGNAIVLYRTENGKITALADACAHRHLPLSRGARIGDEIQCGYHGMRYRADGICSAVPGQHSVPANARVRCYPVAERQGFVWVWTGDPSRASEALITELPWLSDAGWAVVSGYHHVEAAPLFIVDNLLDLSHETFVHAETIGNASVADSPVSAEIVDGDRVRVHRYMANIVPPPLYAEQRGGNPPIDRWHTTTYMPPGIVVIESGSKPSNSDVHDIQERRIMNFVTPETDLTSHYFWCIARNYSLGNEEASRSLRSQVQFTFDQDKELLEAQQRSLGTVTDPSSAVAIKVDAGPIQGRRLLRTLVEREQSVKVRMLSHS